MTKSQITPFPLRLAPDLREKLDAAAKRAGRSLQSEIAARLAATFEYDLGGRMGGGADVGKTIKDPWHPANLQLAPDPENLAKIVAGMVGEHLDDYLAKLVALKYPGIANPTAESGVHDVAKLPSEKNRASAKPKA